jgi:tryptophan 2,3-dioxygenase
MATEKRPVNYDDYLKVEDLLKLQKPKSLEAGRDAHDEMLFIIVHQTYELWFKQILTELDSVLKLFSKEALDERWMEMIHSRLVRMAEIQKLLVDQVKVLETMTPLDFLDFRDLLIPASGFQSYQFRQIETKLGLKREDRLKFNQADYDEALKKSQSAEIKATEKDPSLFVQVERWLERTPFLEMEGFDFWQTYKTSVEKMIKSDLEAINSSNDLDAQYKARNIAMVEASLKNFRAMFDEKAYEEARKAGVWRLSYKAIHAALLIQLYRDQPVLQLPFRVLTALQDLDEWMTTWRQRHALMAKRMLGSRVGSGGSSGSSYLNEAADKHKVFSDFFQLTTFFLPRSKIPVLPKEVEKELGFYYNR